MKKRKLSAGSSRASLVASYGDGSHKDEDSKTAVDPSLPPAKPASAPEKPEPDAGVSSALVDVKTALGKAVEALEAEPDAETDPNDKKVLEGLQGLQGQLAEVEKAQATDDAGDAKAKPAEPVKPPPPKAATAAGDAPAPQTPPSTKAPANPVDEDGNVEDSHPCANPDCGHLASAHEDASGGKNTGPCTMNGCHCPAMEVAVEADEGEAESEGEGETAGEEEKTAAKLAGVIIDGAPGIPGAVPTGDAADTSLNAPPEVEGGDSMGPAFTIPVGIIEGQPTGDGREIAPEALTWRTPPLPLMLLRTGTHDPNGMDMNDPSVLAGRIDSLGREPGEGDTMLITAQGFCLPTEDGMYLAELVEAMGRLGISADVAVESTDMQVGELDEHGFPMDISETLTEGVIVGFTACPFPAFEGAYMVLGDGLEKPEAKAIEQGSEEMAGPVAAKPPDAVTAGGQLVHLMSYEECEACAQDIEVIVASGAGPVRPPKAWFSDPGFTEGDGRLVEIFDKRGRRALGGKFACPITVTADGQVYGHIAPWDVCHTGKPGRCIVAPRSATGGAYFMRGQHLITAEGEKVRVGSITADAGHANLQFSAAVSMSHYDDVATQVADVAYGEDEFGPWVAGAVRPGATEEQIRMLTASSPSGDWREIGGQLELVAALCVPMPGFPTAVVPEAMIAHGQIETLTAAGQGVMNALKHPAEPAEPNVLEFAKPALKRLVRRDARERIAAL